jgi:hypothetical protein
MTKNCKRKTEDKVVMFNRNYLLAQRKQKTKKVTSHKIITLSVVVNIYRSPVTLCPYFKILFLRPFLVRNILTWVQFSMIMEIWVPET